MFACGEKREKTHVALDVQRANHVEFCSMQAKFDIGVAYILDASQDVEKNAEDIPVRDGQTGELVKVVSCAAGCHDGKVVSGNMEEPEGKNNYRGELGAQILALADGTGGIRVMIVFDATSPVRALLKFRALLLRLCYYGSVTTALP